MNPDIDTPALGLPQPPSGIGQSSLGYPQAGAGIAPPPFAIPPTQPAPTTLTSLPPVHQGQPSVSTVPPMPAADAGGAVDDAALDVEWVNKAKEIVARTHADPYLQSRELSRIKAQYIKARYSKEVKVSEES